MGQLTAVDWLIEQVKSKEWQVLYIWQKEDVYRQAKEIEKKQTAYTWEKKVGAKCYNLIHN